MNQKKIAETAVGILLAYIGSWVLFLWSGAQITRENMPVYGMLMLGLFFCIRNLVRINDRTAVFHPGHIRSCLLSVNRRKWETIIKGVSALGLAIVACGYVSAELNGAGIILTVVFTGVLYKFLGNIRFDDRVKVCSVGVLSLLWGTAVVISHKIDRYNWVFVTNFGGLDLIKIIITGALCFVIFYNIVEIATGFGKEKKEDRAFSKKCWLIGALLTFLCWLPYFLSYYPGNLSIDSYASISQAMGTEMLSNHHPVMFTAFVKICLAVGSLFGGMEAGIAVFSIIQMAAFALTLNFCLEWMRTKEVRPVIRICSFLFFAFSPLTALYSFTMWKDILFSCWILLLGIQLFEMADRQAQPDKGDIVRLVVLSFLTAFGRNNGLYIVIAVLAVVLAVYRKSWKKLAPVFSAAVLVIVLIQGPGYDMLNIKKGNLAESLGVPLQQISYTVKYGGNITEEQREFLNKILPEEDMKEAYNPTSANGVKFHADFNNEFLEENKGEFLKVWAEILLKNPAKYVKAYCMHTMGYWQMDTIGYTYCYGPDEHWIHVEDRNILEEITGKNVRHIIEHDLPQIYMNLPVVSLFFCTAFPAWLAAGCLVVLLVKRRGRYIMALVPCIALWGTVMIAAPNSGEFRYVFSLYIAIPFLTAMLFYGKNINSNKKKGYK